MSCSREMPKYRCHKTVWALKIKEIKSDVDVADLDGRESNGSSVIVPSENGYGPFAVSSEYMARHNPKPGGYYVVYDDGYASYSPSGAFESGYTEI